MEYSLRPISAKDRQGVMDIFNYYVENSFAAYPQDKLSYQAFDMFLEVSGNYPTVSIIDKEDSIAGFGMMRSHNPFSSFSHTAEITCFIHQDHTGKGLGKILLQYLENEGRAGGITNILANISSLNPGSIEFHKKNGFIECGCFKNVGVKNGRKFDTIWMQKIIRPNRE
jgi:L-amino acid N-acyltransferase YncA